MTQQISKINECEYWVGKFTFGAGQIFVYDPSIQIANSPHVYLYNMVKSRLEQHNRSDARSKVAKVDKSNVSKYAIESYERWYRIAGKKIVSQGVVHLQGEDRSRCHRVTHCWNCRNPLDNEYDIECRKCGWIICPTCGACKPL